MKQGFRVSVLRLSTDTCVNHRNVLSLKIKSLGLENIVVIYGRKTRPLFD